METRVMKIADISPAEYNPRRDLKPGDYEYDRLKDSIDTFGFVNPLVVNTRNNVLVSGHQRMKVLIEEGVQETEVIAVDLDEEKEKLLNIAMNRIEGDWDYEKLKSVFAEYELEELAVTGFTASEIDSMFAEADNGASIYAGDEETDENEEAEPEDDEEDQDESDDREDNDDGQASNEPCTVYLSFADKERAEAWLAERGINRTFDRSQNIIVRMEGTEYGSASN